MIWRVLLTALYASAFGALIALENFNPGMSDAPLVAISLVAPVIGFSWSGAGGCCSLSSERLPAR